MDINIDSQKNPSVESPPAVTLVGVLERIIYWNEENHYCIGEFVLENKPEGKPITITGCLPGVQCAETLELQGEWTVHPKHGKQLVVKAFAAKLPSSVHGIKKYLASGLIKGIGKRYACKIVDHFGVDTFRVISEQSALLQNVPGIGSGRAHAIKKAWDSQMAVRDIMLFLKTYGVSSSLCLKLVKEYGHQAKAVLLQDPYQVAKHIRGIGFKTADKIALNLGFASDSTQRIDAGLAHVLENFEDEGHTCARHELLLERAVQILQAPCEKIEERLKVLIQLQAIVRL